MIKPRHNIPTLILTIITVMFTFFPLYSSAAITGNVSCKLDQGDVLSLGTITPGETKSGIISGTCQVTRAFPYGASLSYGFFNGNIPSRIGDFSLSELYTGLPIPNINTPGTPKPQSEPCLGGACEPLGLYTNVGFFFYYTLVINNYTPSGDYSYLLIPQVTSIRWPDYGDNIGTIWVRFSVKSQNPPMIFFPNYPTSQPNIDLNLKYSFGGSNAQGDNTLDMCLYDGLNSSTSRATVTLLDENSNVSGRPKGLYSVYKTGGGKQDDSNRIDYNVALKNPVTGIEQTLSNGQEIVLDGLNKPGISHEVALPGIPGTSLCIPAPLKFTTPTFSVSTKNPGSYSGVLRVIYKPST